MTMGYARISGYDPERITAGGIAGETARLEAQARLTFGEELRILEDLGLAEAAPLVDLGCGTGSAAKRIRAARPGLSVLGLDASMTLLSRAAGAESPWPVRRRARCPCGRAPSAAC